MKADDLEQVMEIATSLPDAPHWPQSAYKNAMDPDATPHRIALVIVPVACARKPSAVLGFTVISLLPPQAELETIAVVAESRRRGLGRQIFHALANELKKAGVREIFLEVRASNRVALGFYRSLGFGQTGLRPRYYSDPVEDALVMSLLIV